MPGKPHALVAGIATGLAVLALAFAGDAYLRHGIEVTWRAEREGEIVEVDRTVEHRVAFPNPHRALSRYVQGWDFERWGVPREMPPIDAHIRAVLRVPAASPRIVAAESPNGADVLVDGLRATDPIPPGTHDLAVYWHGPLQPPGSNHWTRTLPASLELVWGPDEESLEPIPREALSLPRGTADPARTAHWIGAVVLAVLLGLGAAWIVGASSAGAARRRAALLATGGIVLLGLGLRLYDYEAMPHFRENMDELFATWNGWSLLEDGTSRGWTLWPAAYGGMAEIERVQYFRGRPMAVVSPYFEHPPLMHLLVGAAAHAGGAKEFLHARLSDTRLVPIALGVITILLVVLVGRRLFPEGPAPWFAGLLYATVPYLALMNRVIKEEALLAPLAVGSLLFFLRWRDDGERWRDLIAAAVLAGLCPLAKVPGLVFVFVLVVLVARRSRWRHAAVAAAFGLAGASLLLVYAAAIDWDLFWYATELQATVRGSRWDQFLQFFYDPLINHNSVGRGTLLFLWLGFVGAVLREKEGRLAALSVPTVGYLVAMGLASGSWHYGWYVLPIAPFLCVGAGRFLADLWERPELLRAAIFVLVPLAAAVYFAFDPRWVQSMDSNADMRRWMMLFTVGWLVPYGLVQVRRTPALTSVARVTTALALAVFAVLNAWTIVRYDVLYETHHDLDDVPICERCD